MTIKKQQQIFILSCLLVLLCASGADNVKVIPLLMQNYYAPGEAINVKLVYYNENGFVTGLPTKVNIYDSKNSLISSGSIVPDSSIMTFSHTLSEGSAPDYGNDWFGWWKVEVEMGSVKETMQFEMRRQVGKRYHRGYYAQYISQRNNVANASIVISPNRLSFTSDEEITLPITVMHGFKPYKGVILVRIYSDKERVYESFEYIDDGRYMPKVSLPKGSYTVVVDTFPEKGRKTQTQNIQFTPAIMIWPSQSPCKPFQVVLLDPETFLPIEGATVSAGGQTVKTNANGVAEFGKLTGQNTITFTLTNGKSSSETVYLGSSCSSGSWTDVTFATDRPIYAPGQTVFFRGYTWKWDYPSIKPVSQDVTYELHGPKGFTILEGSAKSNEYGIYSGKIQLPMNIDEGEYYFEIHDGSGYSIKIEHFERKQLISDIVIEKKNYDHGDTVKGNVSLKYYFGKPATNAKTVITAYWASTDPKSNGYNDYWYDDHYDYEGFGYDYAMPIARGGKVASYYGGYGGWNKPEIVKLEQFKEIELVTDEEGYAHFEIPLDDLSGTHIIIDAEITDPAGRKIELSTNARLAPEINPSMTLDYSNGKLKIDASFSGTNSKNIMDLKLVLRGVSDDLKIGAVNFQNITLSPEKEGESITTEIDISESVALDYMFLQGTLFIIDRYGRTWHTRATTLTKRYDFSLEPYIDGQTVYADVTLIDKKTGQYYSPSSFTWSLTGPDNANRVGHYSTTPFSGSNSLEIPLNQFPTGVYKLEVRSQMGYYKNSDSFYVYKQISKPVFIGTVRQAHMWSMASEITAGESAQFIYNFEGFDRDPFVIEQHYLRGELQKTIVKEVAADTNITVNVATKEGDLGSVSVTVWTIGTNGLTYSAGAATKIKVKELHTKIEISKEIYKPGEKLEFIVKATDQEGNPIKNAAFGIKMTDKSVTDIVSDLDLTARPFTRTYWGTTTNPQLSIHYFQQWYRYGGFYYNKENYDYEHSSTSGGFTEQVDYGAGKELRALKSMARSPGEGNGLMEEAESFAMDDSVGFAGGAAPPMAQAKRSMDRSDMSEEDVAAALSTIQMRSKFPETALWMPFVVTDENGEYKVEMDIPDSLTTWRITTYATTLDCQYATNSSEFFSQKNFFIKPYIPAYITQGDKVTLSLTAHSYFEKDIDMTVGLKKEEWFDLYTPNAAEFVLKKDVPQSVSWELRGRTPFYNNLTFFGLGKDSEGAEYSDGVLRKLWVRPNGVSWNEKESGDTEKEETIFDVFIPEEAYDITIRGYAKFGSETLALYSGAHRLDYYYPYHTTEVAVGRIVPKVLMHNYRKKMQMGYSDHWYYESLRNQYLNLLFMQHNDNAWGWWKKGPSTPYMTSQALYALNLAKNDIYVDSNIIDNAKNWLVNTMNKDGSWNATQWLTGNKAGMTAYILYAMDLQLNDMQGKTYPDHYGEDDYGYEEIYDGFYDDIVADLETVHNSEAGSEEMEEMVNEIMAREELYEEEIMAQEKMVATGSAMIKPMPMPADPDYPPEIEPPYSNTKPGIISPPTTQPNNVEANTPVKRSMLYLHTQFKAGEITDPFTLALYGLLIQRYKLYHEDLESIYETLLELKKTEGSYTFWSRGYSLGGPDETTARVAQLFLGSSDNEKISIAKTALKWLREQNPWEFTSIVDNIAILEAHLKHIEIEPPVIPDMNIELYVNDKLVETTHLSGVWGESGQMRLTDYLKKGKNTIKIVRRGKGKLFYDVWFESVLGGKVKADISTLASTEKGMYPVNIHLKNEASVSTPVRVKMEIPFIEGVDVVPGNIIEIDELKEETNVKIFFVPQKDNIGTLNLGKIKAEFQLKYNNNIEGLDFATWQLPDIDFGSASVSSSSLEVLKEGSYIDNRGDEFLIRLTVRNSGSSTFNGKLMDFVPNKLTPVEYDINDEYGALVWDVTLSPQEEKTFAYSMKGPSGEYFVEEALLFSETEYYYSPFLGKIVLHDDSIAILRNYEKQNVNVGQSNNVSIKIVSGKHHGHIVVEEYIPPGFVVDNYATEDSTVEKVIITDEKITWFLQHLSDKNLWYSMRSTGTGRVQARGTKIFPINEPEAVSFTREHILTIGKGDNEENTIISPTTIPEVTFAVTTIPTPTKITDSTTSITKKPDITKNIEPTMTPEITKRPEISILPKKELKMEMDLLKDKATTIKDEVQRKELLKLIQKIEAKMAESDLSSASEILQNAKDIADGKITVTEKAPRVTVKPADTSDTFSLKQIIMVGALIVVLFAGIMLMRPGNKKGGGSGGYPSQIGGQQHNMQRYIIFGVILLVLGSVFFAGALDMFTKKDSAMNKIEINNKELFSYPQLSISASAPEGEVVDLSYTLSVTFVNRQEKPMEKLTFWLGQTGLSYTPPTNKKDRRYDNSPDFKVSEISGETVIEVDYTHHPVFIGNKRSFSITLKGNVVLNNLVAFLSPSMRTDAFFKDYRVSLNLANGLFLNGTDFNPITENKDKWNPDNAVWSETCTFSKEETQLNNGLCFGDREDFALQIRAHPVTIVDVSINDVLYRNRTRVRDWTVTYQNIGKQSIDTLPLDLGSNAVILQKEMELVNGEIKLSTPLQYNEKIAITAVQFYNHIGYGAAFLSTTNDEIKRAIAPAKTYSAHVEVQGLTVEWASGIAKVYKEKPDGIEEYNSEGSYPIAYNIKVVT